MIAKPNIDVSVMTGGDEYIQLQIRDTEGDAPSHHRKHTGRISAPKDRTPEERAKLRDLWTKAKAAAERLWRSSQGSREEMFGASVELSGLFERLWDLKVHRDDNWVGILDQAQSALKNLAASGEIENIDSDKCYKLFELVEIHLSPATKTIDDLKKAVQIISEMGISPYAGLEALGMPDTNDAS
jgi:hypothetical protein